MSQVGRGAEGGRRRDVRRGGDWKAGESVPDRVPHGPRTTGVQRPGKAEIKELAANMRAKNLLSSCQEVKNLWRKKSGLSKGGSEFEIEEKEASPEGW